jgi:hypothetical protein
MLAEGAREEISGVASVTVGAGHSVRGENKEAGQRDRERVHFKRSQFIPFLKKKKKKKEKKGGLRIRQIPFNNRSVRQNHFFRWLFG